MTATGHDVRRRYKLVVTVICVAVGGLHFVTGSGYSGPFPTFVNGYLIDILLPFAMYLLLGIADLDRLRVRRLRIALVYGAGALAETLQYFGVGVLGRTFDPLDYLMYAFGIILAAMFEWAVFSRPGSA